MNESRLPIGCQHPPFLLVDTHVGVQTNTEQGHHLATHYSITQHKYTTIKLLRT